MTRQKFTAVQVCSPKITHGFIEPETLVVLVDVFVFNNTVSATEVFIVDWIKRRTGYSVFEKTDGDRNCPGTPR
jgi:hypothetical protein